MTARISRRSFVQSAALATAGVMTGASSVSAAPGGFAAQRRRPRLDKFSDLRRHFLFEYYPWYRTDPWEHWDEAGRRPPGAIASNYVPALGAYDSRSAAMLERHARWIADSGVGAIDVSWWGPDSNVNEVIPLLMDVMAAHDMHVAFYVEPYTESHAQNYARDLLYLIRNYGDRRHWDCFLLLEHAHVRARLQAVVERLDLPGAVELDEHRAGRAERLAGEGGVLLDAYIHGLGEERGAGRYAAQDR